MARAVAAFVFLIVLGVFAAWLADRPGTLGLDWQGYRIEMPVGLGIGGAIVLMTVAALLYQAWRWVRRGPADLARARAQRRRERGQLALTRGMVAVAAGDRAAALRFSREAERYLNDTPLTMLLAAQAAQLGGDDKAARLYFSAMLKRPELEFLGLRGLVGQAGRSGDRDSALDLARRAYAISPQTPWVLSALFDLEARAGNWREAERVATRAVAANALDEPDGRRRQAISLMQIAHGLRDQGEQSQARKMALKAHALEPDFLPATLMAIDLLTAAGKRRRAQHLIEQTWRAGPHPEIAMAHRRLYHDDAPANYVSRVEHLTGDAPQDHEARLFLAEAAVDAGAADQAAQVLGATADDPRAEGRVLRLKARIEETLHGPSAGRKWLERVESAPDPAWICNVCGHHHAGWKAHCRHCESFDSLRWGSRGDIAVSGQADLFGHLPPVDDDVAQAESPGIAVFPDQTGADAADKTPLRAAG